MVVEKYPTGIVGDAVEDLSTAASRAPKPKRVEPAKPPPKAEPATQSGAAARANTGHS